ncbi:MAG: DNA repair protein RadC [Bacteroidia bacterium]|nr:DNA repair protein RadC [Bacteroidia bacterium]
MEHYTHTTIKDWAVEDRPREKLLQRGIEALTDAELIAILLASGTRERSAIDLAREMIETVGGLPQIAQADVAELTQLKGIGKAKAITVIAAFELGRRKLLKISETPRLTHSESVAKYLSPRLADLKQEVFYVLFLNRNNEIIAEKQIFRGGVSATIIDPRIVFREAIHHLASAIILSHNHPSGNLTPSQADIEITRKLISGGKVFDIQVLDHIIVSARGYYSFADQGLLS